MRATPFVANVVFAAIAGSLVGFNLVTGPFAVLPAIRSAMAHPAQRSDVAHKTDRLPLYSASSASVTVLAPAARQLGMIDGSSGVPLNASIVVKNVVSADATPIAPRRTPRNIEPEMSAPQPRTLRADAGNAHRTQIAAR
jgi:hypothetical protein